MPFGTNCGKPINPNDKFCASCGSKLKNSESHLTPQSQPPQQTAVKIFTNPLQPQSVTAIDEAGPKDSLKESIQLVFPDYNVRKGLLSADQYTLVVTNKRTIFAKQTREVEEQALKQYRAKIDAVKDVSGVIKWIAKKSNSRAYIEWYSDKTPDSIIDETSGNYAIDNSNILSVTSKFDGDEEFPIYYIHFTTVNEVIKGKTMINPDALVMVYRHRK
jgi:hypothetical protein